MSPYAYLPMLTHLVCHHMLTYQFVDATIRDEEGQIVPDGETGELYIGGELLARGYLLKPELTAERFVYFSGGGAGAKKTRVYRTGDRVRRLANGMVRRVDFMYR